MIATVNSSGCLIMRENNIAYYGELTIFKEEFTMRKPKVDKFGVGMAFAFGGLSWLLYLCGKGTGRVEAYTNVANIMEDALKEAAKQSENKEV